MNHSIPLCLNTNLGFEESDETVMEKIARAGFDGLFTHWEREYPMEQWARKVKELGLLYQSLHAPHRRLNALWDEQEAGEESLRELTECLECCARHEIPLMVLHVICGFDLKDPTELGAERFEKILSRADALGVKIGFENTEGEMHLARVMAMTGHKSLGYCWDSGHQMCYNERTDLLALYGRRLCGVHLNDNMGRTGERIFFHDDAHMLPGDGIADWKRNVRRLKALGFQGPLTFEIKRNNQPGRHTQDRYLPWSLETFLSQTMERAEWILRLWEEE